MRKLINYLIIQTETDPFFKTDRIAHACNETCPLKNICDGNNISLCHDYCLNDGKLVSTISLADTENDINTLAKSYSDKQYSKHVFPESWNRVYKAFRVGAGISTIFEEGIKEQELKDVAEFVGKLALKFEEKIKTDNYTKDELEITKLIEEATGNLSLALSILGDGKTKDTN